MTKPKAPKIDMPSPEQLEMATRPYSDEELEGEEVQAKVDRLMQFFDQYGIPYDKFEPGNRNFLGDRKAYPNYDQYIYTPGQHNMDKWMNAVRNLFAMEKGDVDRVTAIRRATNGWNPMETYDFLNWLKFYQEGAHMKYKYAQLWYENGQPGYFINIKKDPEPAPTPHTDGNAIQDAYNDVNDAEERKRTIEKQRAKIVGRLDSAEKLLRSPEGQMFAGKELENLMEAIYSLKKKVQLVNKLSTSIRLYEDMIIREGNVLRRHGFVKAAEMLYSLAQTPGQAGEDAKGKKGGDIVPPPPAPPGDPSGAGNPGAPGGLPSAGPGMPAGNPSTVSPPSPPNENQPGADEVTNKGVGDFLRNTETSNLTVADDTEAEDDLEVADGDELLVTEAQLAPPPGDDAPITTNPAPARGNPVKPPVEKPDDAPKPPTGDGPVATEEPLEVTEDDIPKGDGGAGAAQQAAQFDARVDQLFANLQVADVVAKLEDLAKIFKVREVPRQLAIVDMMLDSLGLASYFPSLSEAQNKALESNNYISTRVEDILSKLRGAMSTKDVDLKGGPPSERPEVAGIKSNLENDAAKEKQQKQMRKEQEAAKLQGGPPGKETPEVEMGEDLGGGPPPAAPPGPKPPAPPAV